MPTESPQLTWVGVRSEFKATKEINIIGATWQISDSLRTETSPA
jgi:hypothetical protein